MAAELFVGVISGTSVDGLDLALLAIDDGIRFVHVDTAPMDVTLRDELLALGQSGADEIDRLGAADRKLGRAIGMAVNEFLSSNGVDSSAVAAIGSHGQTVRHRPAGADPFSLQLGDPNQIVEVTGITCVADFRRRDMAAGGQGAPLVPPFHAMLFRSADEDRIVLNIGGISNITALPSDPNKSVTGFDTGPGNCLMDAWIGRCRQLTYDADGGWAAQGHADARLLSEMLSNPYLHRPPPKSTGREHYHLDWLTGLQCVDGVAEVDVQATLLEFTALSIKQAMDNWAPGCSRVLVCGGGRSNSALMARLAILTACPVETTDRHGVDGDTLEAGAFAWLARQTLRGLPGNDPNVSGASGSRVLGALYRR